MTIFTWLEILILILILGATLSATVQQSFPNRREINENQTIKIFPKQNSFNRNQFKLFQALKWPGHRKLQANLTAQRQRNTASTAWPHLFPRSLQGCCNTAIQGGDGWRQNTWSPWQPVAPICKWWLSRAHKTWKSSSPGPVSRLCLKFRRGQTWNSELWDGRSFGYWSTWELATQPAFVQERGAITSNSMQTCVIV